MAVLLVLGASFGGFIACAAPPVGSEATGNRGQAQSENEETDDSSEVKTGKRVGSPTVDTDGGVETTIRPTKATFTIDGKTCTLSSTEAGLDLGLDGNGWAVSVHSSKCAFGASIYGTDDGGYPQSEALSGALGGTSRVWLFTGEGGDAGAPNGGTYKSSAGAATIKSGPTNGKKGNVTGSATVETDEGSTKEVSFSFTF